ncbi:hypothetical protein GCM10010960_18110 [Arenimonas maotaiensis]|uniref:DGQHR domain-containing protein n=1 Tax=Arenimonas maotaiensis TaxID=1446479 RepID=A0A917CTQ9_9GAMM|nr:DGQHR domain-containing protein [Arenimonas maotaiensis]GGF96835.1 hypothetical protein GCM10010960_18110 [Arenimonas maotaiensis]
MSSISVPALKVRQPIGEFFVCSFSARDLIKISWVDVRKISSEAGEIDDYLGIQRKISESRVKQIRRYVKTLDATFPTSIIVAIPGRCARWNEEKRELSIFEYKNSDDPSQNVNFDRIAKILDGQHRLRGLAQPDGDQFSFDLPDDVPFELNVVVFVEADIAQQATIFSTVNLAQTKVNKSLVYDLFSLAKSRSPQKSAHAIAVALDKESGSPFYKSLKRLGVATPGRGEFDEYLTQSTFVEALLHHITPNAVNDRDFFLRSLSGRLKYPSQEELERYVFRGLFAEEKEGEIAKILWAYFDAVRTVWPNSWSSNERGNIIRRTNGFRAFMAVFAEIYKKVLSGEKIGSFVHAREYIPILKSVNIKDGGFTADAFPPGSSGESALKRELRSAINGYIGKT